MSFPTSRSTSRKDAVKEDFDNVPGYKKPNTGHTLDDCQQSRLLNRKARVLAHSGCGKEKKKKATGSSSTEYGATVR